MKIMKIMTFNIRHGGGTRVHAIIKSVTLHNPDVLILTEYRENKNADAFRKCLANSGYLYLVSGTCNPIVNSVLIASRIPFVPCLFDDFKEPEKTRSLVGARFDGINIIGGYFPGQDRKYPVFEYLLNDGMEFLSDTGLIIGDFNTGKHYLDEKGASFYGTEYFDQLEEVGLIDSWRTRNPDKREYSWYSNHGNGFRLDHVFSTSACDSKISQIYYSHSEREEKVSDHSAMIVDLPFEGSTVHEVEGILSNRVLIKQVVSSQL